MAICKSCGKEIAEGAIVCKHCGAEWGVPKRPKTDGNGHIDLLRHWFPQAQSTCEEDLLVVGRFQSPSNLDFTARNLVTQREIYMSMVGSNSN